MSSHLHLDLAFLHLDLNGGNPASQLVSLLKDLAKVDHGLLTILSRLLLLSTASLMGLNLLLETVLNLPSVALEDATAVLGDAHSLLVHHSALANVSAELASSLAGKGVLHVGSNVNQHSQTSHRHNRHGPLADIRDTDCVGNVKQAVDQRLVPKGLAREHRDSSERNTGHAQLVLNLKDVGELERELILELSSGDTVGVGLGEEGEGIHLVGSRGIVGNGVNIVDAVLCLLLGLDLAALDAVDKEIGHDIAEIVGVLPDVQQSVPGDQSRDDILDIVHSVGQLLAGHRINQGTGLLSKTVDSLQNNFATDQRILVLRLATLQLQADLSQFLGSHVAVGLGKDADIAQDVLKVDLGRGQLGLAALLENERTKALLEAEEVGGEITTLDDLGQARASRDKVDELVGILVSLGGELFDLVENDALAALLVTDRVEAVDNDEDVSLLVGGIPEELLALLIIVDECTKENVPQMKANIVSVNENIIHDYKSVDS